MGVSMSRPPSVQGQIPRHATAPRHSSLATTPHMSWTATTGDPSAGSVRRVAAVMLEHLEGLAARSAAEIWNREQELRGRVSSPDGLIGPCRVTIGCALRSLAQGKFDDTTAQELRVLGRRSSEQGLPLETLLRALRVDSLVLWGEMLLVARSLDPSILQGLVDAAEIVSRIIDDVTVEFTTGYCLNQGERALADERRRDALLDGLLVGQPVNPKELGELLGLAPFEPLMAIALQPNGETAIDDLARRLRYASAHSVWTEREGLLVGLVAMRGQAPTSIRSALRRGGALRGGLSVPVHGIAALPEAVSEARLALAALAPGQNDVVDVFADPIATLVASDPALAKKLVGEILKPLIVRPRRDRDTLISTLVAFDEEGGSLAGLAARFFCHRNTVLNRLTKITTLTGLCFDRPADLARITLTACVLRLGMIDLSSAVEPASSAAS